MAGSQTTTTRFSFLDMWMTGGGNNDAQYANDDYDALIKQAKTTTDNAERMDLLHQAEDKLIGEDSVLAPLYFYTHFIIPCSRYINCVTIGINI